MKIQIKKLKDSFLAFMVQGFDDSNWTKKPFSLFEKYLKEQKEGKRIVLVAFADGSFAGYVTLVWQSNYKQFSLNRIPEMKDFNVLPTLRRSLSAYCSRNFWTSRVLCYFVCLFVF